MLEDTPCLCTEHSVQGRKLGGFRTAGLFLAPVVLYVHFVPISITINTCTCNGVNNTNAVDVSVPMAISEIGFSLDVL